MGELDFELDRMKKAMDELTFDYKSGKDCVDSFSFFRNQSKKVESLIDELGERGEITI